MNDVAASGTLAPYAAHDGESRGRRFPEERPELRGEFQRDRDRIIHSNAFRRLVYKTQVFVNHEGDLYRTRITHSIEVAQIARSVALALHLNEALTEAISLAHDLGHTPFGHAGQDALNECMRDYGGFEHNLQSLRVVDELEERYASFRGLNLTFETREGILKHCSLKKARELGDVGERFLERHQPSLEAQLANLADEIAYNNHDVDDGLRSGLITLEQLEQLPFFAEHMRWVEQRHSALKPQRLGSETVRRMISHLVSGLIDSSAEAITAAAPSDIEAVRSLGQPLIRFPSALQDAQHALKKFLRAELYAHPHVHLMTQQAQETVRWLFEMLSADYALMPEEHAERARAAAERGDEAASARVVADYIAGMTDRFALQTRDALRARL